MIKFLISLIIITSFYSCKEFQKENISNNLDKGIGKIEKIIDKKKTKKIDYKQDLKQKDNIFYYIGDPYFIEGVKYIPEENFNYSEIGLSTYYGKELHNVRSINNDFNKVTELLGRHKTLPLPSMVQITNLDNGLSIVIKVIDRHDDNSSLIQVSRKVAQLLGFYKDKIATVRVDILSDASKQWRNVAMSLNEPEFDKTITSAPTSIVSISDIENGDTILKKEENITQPIELISEEVEEYSLFLKIFNFEDYNNIQSVTKSLDNKYKYTSEKNGSKYDIVIGPINKEDINKLVSYFIAKGYKETKIILN